MGGLCLLRFLISSQKQRQAITSRSDYKYYYCRFFSCNSIVFETSSIIPKNNFPIHTLSRIANPNPNLSRGDIFKRSWDDVDLVSSGECTHAFYHIGGVFSNSIADRIVQLDTINFDIYLCCRLNQVNYGFSLLGGIIKLGLVPNRYTYCPLLIGLMYRNLLKEAIYLFDVLIVRGEIHPDFLTYETILQVGFDMGSELDIDRFAMFLSYASIIIGYEAFDMEYCMRHHPWCQGLNFGQAYCAVMCHSVPKHVLLNNYCKDKWYRLTLEILRDLELDLSVVAIEVYNTVFSHMVYAGEIDQALDLFYRECKDKLKPTAKTYATIILGLSYKGLWDQALDMLTDVYSSNSLPREFKLACENFFQERLPPYFDMPYLADDVSPSCHDIYLAVTQDWLQTVLIKPHEP